MKVILLSLLFCLLFCSNSVAQENPSNIYILDDVLLKFDNKALGIQFRVINYCNVGTVWHLGNNYSPIQVMMPDNENTPMTCKYYKERKVNE